jgi:hypothetical protein
VSFDQYHPAPRRRLTLVGSRDTDASPHPVVAHVHTAVRHSSDNPPVESGNLTRGPLLVASDLDYLDAPDRFPAWGIRQIAGRVTR